MNKPLLWFGLLSSTVAVASQSASAATTSTTLSIRSDGETVSTVQAGRTVTLTAAVKASGAAVKAGTVNFCNLDQKNCTGNRLLGTAQLTKSGQATLTLIPGIGSHSYTAVFLGNGADASSTSSSKALKVAGNYATTTTVSPGGGPGNYTLTASVTGLVNSSGTPAPTGTAAFFNATRSNSALGTAPLHSSASTLTFLNPGSAPTGPNPKVFAVADFNGDGIPDVAVSTDVTTTPDFTQNGATILLGKGDGTFKAAPGSPAYVTGLSPEAIATGDFNADGNTDIAIAADSPTGGIEVDILLGKGNGRFTQAPAGPALQGSTAYNVAVGDFNGDGILDLAVSDSSDVFLLLGKGDGTFTQPAWSPLQLIPNVFSLTAGDLNGDGIADLIAISSGAPPYGTSSQVAIYLGNRNAATTVLSQAPGSPMGLGSSSSKTAPRVDNFRAALGDFNGDGIPDLVVTQNTGIVLLLGNGDGTFAETPASPISSAYGETPLVADFNGDGKADVAIGNGDPAFLLVLLGNGDGALSQAASSTPSVAYTAAADLNGDGIPDLVALDTTNNVVDVLLVQPTTSATATLSHVPSAVAKDKVKAMYSGNRVYDGSISPSTKW